MMDEPTNAITHLVGAGLAVAALVILVVQAALRKDAWHVVGFAVFGSALILLYIASTLYHSFRGRVKRVFLRIDHAMIYVLIAGTYTPLCLTVLRGAWGWSLFGIIWGCALLGVAIKAFGLGTMSHISTILYIVMGWLAAVAIVPIRAALSSAGLFWLVLGGVLYTVGALFFALDRYTPRTRWFGMHEVFHLFVIGGSLSHFFLMLQI